MAITHSSTEQTPLSPRTPHSRDFPLPPSYSTIDVTAYSAAPGNTSEPLPDLPTPSPAFSAAFTDKFRSKTLREAVTAFHDDEEQTLSPPRPSWWERVYLLVIDWWLWEILSWLVSALCLVGVAVLLGYYDGRTLPSRWPGGISLNTAVAVLSGIAKYAMSVPLDSTLGQLKWRWFRSGKPRKLIDVERFDDATRGPWGAISLLWHLRGKHLASLSAIIVVLTLAFEPFFQQVVATPKRPGAFGKSSLSRVVHYKSRQTKSIQNGLNATIAENEMQAYVIDAFKYNASNAKVEPFCPTSNCQWPAFKTLGVCNQCKDISDLLTFGCMQESGSWLPARSTAWQGMNGTIDQTPITSCGYFLNATSSNPVLMTGYRVENASSSPQPGEALFAKSLPLIVSTMNQTWWDRSYSFRAEVEMLPLHDFMMAMHTDVASVYANKTPMAAECILRWCVKTIEAKVEDGFYSEKILSTFTNDTMVGWPKLHWSDYIQDWDDTVQDIYITPPDDNDTYFISDNDVFSSINPLRVTIPTYWTTRSPDAQPLVRTLNIPYSGMDSASSMIEHFTMDYWSHLTSVFHWADQVTEAMTNAIRGSKSSSVPVKGYGGLETYIHIQWGWLCVPLLMLMFCLTALIATIKTAPCRSEGGIWKSSSLAVLLHGFGPESHHKLQIGSTMKDMRAHANELDVRLDMSDDGLRFVIYPRDIRQRDSLRARLGLQ